MLNLDYLNVFTWFQLIWIIRIALYMLSFNMKLFQCAVSYHKLSNIGTPKEQFRSQRVPPLERKKTFKGPEGASIGVAPSISYYNGTQSSHIQGGQVLS